MAEKQYIRLPWTDPLEQKEFNKWLPLLNKYAKAPLPAETSQASTPTPTTDTKTSSISSAAAPTNPPPALAAAAASASGATTASTTTVTDLAATIPALAATVPAFEPAHHMKTITIEEMVQLMNAIRVGYDRNDTPVPAKPCPFVGLTSLLQQHYTAEERDNFLQNTFPFLCWLLTQGPTFFPASEPLPLLAYDVVGEVTLSKKQCAVLLSCAFFSVISHRGIKEPKPDFHFIHFLAYADPAQWAKVKMVFNYFDRMRKCWNAPAPTAAVAVTDSKTADSKTEVNDDKPVVSKDGKTEAKEGKVQQVPSSYGFVTIYRHGVRAADFTHEFLAGNKTPLQQVRLHSKGTIEDCGDALQIDFANEYIGGGVLFTGCVQEEIRFCINPECLVSLLITSKMQRNESITIIGAEQFSTYTGYARNLGFGGDYVDPTPLDSRNRRRTAIVGIDALVAFAINQFNPQERLREVVKAYAGFALPSAVLASSYPNIATGNWGCGAFGGDIVLKFCLQAIAASLAGRSIDYFTFGHPLAVALEPLLPKLTNRTVSDLWTAVDQFVSSTSVAGKRMPGGQALLQFLLDRFK